MWLFKGRFSEDRNYSLYFDLLILLLIAVFIFLFLFPYSPPIKSVPNRDSGAFLYIGDQILNGGLPYISVWDHKGPLLYYINTFAVFISPLKWNETWIIEFLFILGAAIFGYLALKRVYDRFVAVIGTLSWLTILPFLLEGGNLTEEYALLFQFCAIFIFSTINWEKNKVQFYKLFLIGCTAGCCLLLKPNLIGVQLSVIFFILLKGTVLQKIRQSVIEICTILFGAILIIIPFIVYFTFTKILGEFFDQYLFYNFIYSKYSQYSNQDTIRHGFALISFANIDLVVIASIFLFIYYFYYLMNNRGKFNSLAFLMIILLPIELFISAIPGHTFPHYYMSWLPMISLAIGFFSSFYKNDILFSQVNKMGKRINQILIVIIIFGLCFSPLVYVDIYDSFLASNRYFSLHSNEDFQKINLLKLQYCDIPENYFFWKTGTAYIEKSSLSLSNAGFYQVLDYLAINSTSSDYILFLGAEPEMNHILQKDAPTRFVYQYPLMNPNYRNVILIKEFKKDVINKKPKYIIDTHQGFLPLDSNLSVIPNESSVEDWELYSLQVFLRMNYRFVFNFSNGWSLFEIN